MRLKTALALFATALLASCGLWQEQTLKAGYAPVTTRADFLDRVEGRNWEADGILVRFDEAGRIHGTVAGEPVGGTWRWQGEEFCMRFRVADSGGKGCARIRARPGEILVVPIDGWGAPYVYTEVPSV